MCVCVYKWSQRHDLESVWINFFSCLNAIGILKSFGIVFLTRLCL